MNGKHKSCQEHHFTKNSELINTHDIQNVYFDGAATVLCATAFRCVDYVWFCICLSLDGELHSALICLWCWHLHKDDFIFLFERNKRRLFQWHLNINSGIRFVMLQFSHRYGDRSNVTDNTETNCWFWVFYYPGTLNQVECPSSIRHFVFITTYIHVWL